MAWRWGGMLFMDAGFLGGLIVYGMFRWQRLVDISFSQSAGEAFSELSYKFMITYGYAAAPERLPGTTFTQSCFDPFGIYGGQVLVLFQTKQ
jgi:hypothetical protein